MSTSTPEKLDLKALKPGKNVDGWVLIYDKDWQTRKEIRFTTGVIHHAKSPHPVDRENVRLATEAEQAKSDTWRHCSVCERAMKRAEDGAKAEAEKARGPKAAGEPKVADKAEAKSEPQPAQADEPAPVDLNEALQASLAAVKDGKVDEPKSEVKDEPKTEAKPRRPRPTPQRAAAPKGMKPISKRAKAQALVDEGLAENLKDAQAQLKDMGE
jgi:hypothetical protein